ncbi:MAG: tRNA (guanosine(37)-N1)-methyltransferase TrmD [Robiginitomaculum sp.]|nr:tRNA (guanosine(37)-N1)-methyltransferase TrmD [Robiginitomaculum sp.]MDQ7076657.1 tRNA (guanosine(37)-N1)-methyltransferase TrmD [Robiginitomaculum sp.]
MSAPFTATVLTLYPDAFPGVLGASLIGRALTQKKWQLETLDIRSFSHHKHASVDDTPAGGGPGMVLRPDVAAAAMDAVDLKGRPLIYLSPRGKPLTQAMVREYAAGPGLVLFCGRFEGLDQRVIEAREMVEISVGDFVLAGGEVAAQAMIEACVRLLPGVLGAAESTDEESFEGGLLEYPHYTRPRIWEGRETPPVLLSGDHGAVAKWRRDEAIKITRARRPDLLGRAAGKENENERD